MPTLLTSARFRPQVDTRLGGVPVDSRKLIVSERRVVRSSCTLLTGRACSPDYRERSMRSGLSEVRCQAFVAQHAAQMRVGQASGQMHHLCGTCDYRHRDGDRKLDENGELARGATDLGSRHLWGQGGRATSHVGFVGSPRNCEALLEGSAYSNRSESSGQGPCRNVY